MSQINSSRYLVGIDLGTTNCAVAYFDSEKRNPAVQLFRIPQLGKHGHEESLTLLPSVVYIDEPGIVVGMWAKIQGAQIPTRLVQSAKSWLSNPAANRREKILPFESVLPDKRLTPVEASSHYLEHIKIMWNRYIAKGNPNDELEEQEIILTVPASFDEVARSLTVEAAARVGFKHITLLEEPQAAFYNWLMEHGKEDFKPGESILVCDIGGGTSDFSLIDIIEGSDGIEMRRMAVGKHLLLGGDNMDATLCYALERQLTQELDTTQHLALLHQARAAKESLLNEEAQNSYPIFLAGKGSQVVGGSLSLELTQHEVKSLLLEGFFGIYSFEEAIQLKKGSGIRQMGLAYEAEPSITKHLAHFLYKNGRKEKPTYLLFNGGAMKPKDFQNRIVDSLETWFGGERKVQVLTCSSLELAVARGAAYFGKVRQGEGIYIGGGVPRSYYLEIDDGHSVKRALTLMPRGANEDTRLLSKHLFFLIPNQPVVFQLYHSHTRLNDKVGDFIPIEEEELTRLPPIQTICQFGKKKQTEKIPVQLEIYLTAVGTLELWLLSQTSDHRWKLEFQLREEGHEKRFADETVDVSFLESAQKEIQNAFAVGAQARLNSLMTTLEHIFDKERKTWSPSVLRGLYETLSAQADKRSLSNLYESRFWNLAGFLLRPGMGYPLDDHRVKELWKIILTDLKKPKSEETQLQQWICYRRISAGFSKGQQIQLFSELLHSKVRKEGYAYAEHLRALASLELIDISAKIKLGVALIDKIIKGKGEPCDYWALGRLGARQLFYGTAANSVPRTTCEEWIMQLLNAPAAQNIHLPFTLAMLARKTNYREIDISPSIQEKIAPLVEEQQDLLFHERELTIQEQERFFGDSLPSGLSFFR